MARGLALTLVLALVSCTHSQDVRAQRTKAKERAAQFRNTVAEVRASRDDMSDDELAEMQGIEEGEAGMPGAAGGAAAMGGMGMGGMGMGGMGYGGYGMGGYGIPPTTGQELNRLALRIATVDDVATAAETLQELFSDAKPLIASYGDKLFVRIGEPFVEQLDEVLAQLGNAKPSDDVSTSETADRS